MISFFFFLCFLAVEFSYSSFLISTITSFSSSFTYDLFASALFFLVALDSFFISFGTFFLIYLLFFIMGSAYFWTFVFFLPLPFPLFFNFLNVFNLTFFSTLGSVLTIMLLSLSEISFSICLSSTTNSSTDSISSTDSTSSPSSGELDCSAWPEPSYFLSTS